MNNFMTEKHLPHSNEHVSGFQNGTQCIESITSENQP